MIMKLHRYSSCASLTKVDKYVCHYKEVCLQRS
ncbi:hypothetical protein AAZX31_11G044000 [Glycine max]